MQFNANAVAAALRHKILGQEEALWQIASLLQTVSLQLQAASGCFCQLLLAGPAHTGKATVAQILVDYFASSAMPLLHATPTTANGNTIRLTANCRKQGMVELGDAVAQFPRAMVLLENIEQFSTATLAVVREMVSEGYHTDPTGKEIDFSRITLIMTTDISATHFPAAVTAPVHVPQDLMQLLGQEAPQKVMAPQLAADNLRRALLPALASQLPAWLLQIATVIPFMPVSLASVQQIVKQKITALSEHLLIRHQVQLAVNPEVCHYLAEKVFQGCYAADDTQLAESPDNVLLQLLHPCLAQQLIGGNITGGTLRVQLNESGEVLMCECTQKTAQDVAVTTDS
jgi:type VI secretion system protein VasG